MEQGQRPCRATSISRGPDAEIKRPTPGETRLQPTHWPVSTGYQIANPEEFGRNMLLIEAGPGSPTC